MHFPQMFGLHYGYMRHPMGRSKFEISIFLGKNPRSFPILLMRFQIPNFQIPNLELWKFGKEI